MTGEQAALAGLGVAVIGLVGKMLASIWAAIKRFRSRRIVRIAHALETANQLADDPRGWAVGLEDRSAVRLAHAFLASQSHLAEEIALKGRILWPPGRNRHVEPRRIKLPPDGAGNFRIMVEGRRWRRPNRRYLLTLWGETARGKRVKGRVWTQLSGYQWGEPPGIAG
jgi:hypothetical protein